MLDDDLHRQIEESEQRMRENVERLDGIRAVRAQLEDAVGRGEAADGKVVVEWGATGVHDVVIDPHATKLTSDELSTAVKDAIVAATADLRTRTMEALQEAGLAGAQPPDLAATKEQLERAQAQMSDALRDASAKIGEAQRIRRDVVDPG